VLASVPLYIVFNIAFGLFLESTKDNSLPVGIVDFAGVFQSENQGVELLWERGAENGERIEFIHFDVEQEANNALTTNAIQAYYLLPEDYAETRRVEQIYLEEPGRNAERQFFDYLQVSLISSQPEEIAYRAAAGTFVTVRSVDGTREVRDSGPTFGLLMPLFVSMAFLFMVLMSSGYVMGAVVEEKENRTMEVLVTTISPIQLIGGKVLGIVAISTSLLLAWGGVIVLGALGAQKLGIEWFNDLSMDWRAIFSTLLIALPAYVLAIALMTAIGSIATKTEEGQSMSAIFFILHFAPLYVSWVFINDPHSPLGVVLSLLPFTSLLTVGMRNLFSIVPVWQIVISVIVQSVCALFALWLASRAFRLGMLRYGQRLRLPRLFTARS
jgi:ABC-2 type transport system permease protein